MEEVTQVVPVVKARYSKSRKGIGGRKRKYSPEQLGQIMVEVKSGMSLLKVCKDNSVPYVSVRAALKRDGMWPVVVPKV